MDVTLELLKQYEDAEARKQYEDARAALWRQYEDAVVLLRKQYEDALASKICDARAMADS